MFRCFSISSSFNVDICVHLKTKKTRKVVRNCVKIISAVLSLYVSIIDQSMDGILGLLFQDKVSNFQFIIFCCYLPPEDSLWGRDSDSFYAHLLGQIYIHNYVDTYFICGDLNGHTGNHDDFTRDVDQTDE